MVDISLTWGVRLLFRSTADFRNFPNTDYGDLNTANGTIRLNFAEQLYEPSPSKKKIANAPLCRATIWTKPKQISTCPEGLALQLLHHNINELQEPHTLISSLFFYYMSCSIGHVTTEHQSCCSLIQQLRLIGALRLVLSSLLSDHTPVWYYNMYYP